MGQLFGLLHSLSESEKEVLLHSLSYTPKNNNGRENLMAKLANYILASKKVPTLKEYSEGIYGINAAGKKIINLKKRLYTRSLNLFITDSEVLGNDHLDEQDKAWILNKTKLAQFYALFYSGRGAELSLDILDEAIRSSKKYEHYLVLIECMRFKKWIVGFLNGGKQFEEYQKEISKYEISSKLVEKAVDTVYSLDIKSVFQANRDRRRTNILKKRIEELKEGNVLAKSKVAEYYITFLEIDHLMNKREYELARSKCIHLVNFIRTSPSVFRRQRIASLYCNQSRCHLFLEEYGAAKKMAQAAQEYLQPGTTNFAIAKEQEFYACFYPNDIIGAEACLADLTRMSRPEKGEFRNSKYEFFQACVYFKKGEFSEANRILTSHQDVSKDKEGWDIAIRVLRIMCNIELGRTEQASLLIESARKHISTHCKGNKEKAVHDAKINLLRRIEQSEYNFGDSNSKLLQQLSVIRKMEKQGRLSVIGPELISFSSWVDSCIKRKLKS